jgi:glycosyltransferase involved in cell wall biosynthesis
VFLSKLTSLPETGGSAAYYWQDLVPEKMAAEVTARLSVDADREALLKNAARFDWDKCADEYIEYYLSILGL